MPKWSGWAYLFKRTVRNNKFFVIPLLAVQPGIDLAKTLQLQDRIEFPELASLPEFPGAFARAMGFRT